MIEEEEKRVQQIEDDQLKFVRERFHKTKLPWQRTITSEQFRGEIAKEFGTSIQPQVRALIDKV